MLIDSTIGPLSSVGQEYSAVMHSSKPKGHRFDPCRGRYIFLKILFLKKYFFNKFDFK